MQIYLPGKKTLRFFYWRTIVVDTILKWFGWNRNGKVSSINKQDGRLAPAYFSPNYKYFDQLLQTVKNENSVWNLVFKGFFTNINSTTDFYIFWKEGVSRFCVENFLSHSAEKIRRGTLRCFKKFRVSKNFMHKRGDWGIAILRRKFFVSQYRNSS